MSAISEIELTTTLTQEQESLEGLIHKLQSLQMYYNSAQNQPKIQLLRDKIKERRKALDKKEVQANQARTRFSYARMIKLIKGLSEQEKTHLCEFLYPVLLSRKKFLDYVLIEIPKDLKEMEEIQNLIQPLLGSTDPDDKTKLVELIDEREKLRARINGVPKEGRVTSGHAVEREHLDKERIQSKGTFDRQY